MQAEGAHRVSIEGDDAHDGREAPAAHRARARLIPQYGRALDAEPAVAALEQDGVGGSLQADHARIFVIFGEIIVRVKLLVIVGIRA